MNDVDFFYLAEIQFKPTPADSFNLTRIQWISRFIFTLSAT
ncbi:hypothetical protein [Oligoflexus tunisiensis]|nr:hypothetical protein [Oligoflexus tunisiensis]